MLSHGVFFLRAHFKCRLFLFGPGIGIWRSCRLIGALMRSLCSLSGGLAGFVPHFSVDHCRLRHIGWEKCGNGLLGLVKAPLFLLLAGTLRYCFDRFDCLLLVALGYYLCCRWS